MIHPELPCRYCTIVGSKCVWESICGQCCFAKKSGLQSVRCTACGSPTAASERNSGVLQRDSAGLLRYAQKFLDSVLSVGGSLFAETVSCFEERLSTPKAHQQHTIIISKQQQLRSNLPRWMRSFPVWQWDCLVKQRKMNRGRMGA